MTVNMIPASQQLTLTYDARRWQLAGPDGRPVFEARPGAVFYHPAFGRWRDLPPGKKLEADVVQNVELRWDQGWAIGLTLPLPTADPWRGLVRWQDTRALQEADRAAQALSAVLGCPLVSRTAGLVAAPPAAPAALPEAPVIDDTSQGRTHEGFATRSPTLPMTFAHDAVPDFLEDEPRQGFNPVYTVQEEPEARLPLRLGHHGLLSWGKNGLLQIRQMSPDVLTRRHILLLDLLAAAAVIIVALLLVTGRLGSNPVLAVGITGMVVVAALLGTVFVRVLRRGTGKLIALDKGESCVAISEGRGEQRRSTLPLSAVQGVRVAGKAIQARGKLAYHREVYLMMDSGDVFLFDETRPANLPPDPADAPSLHELRRMADEKAGPSLVRAGARYVAWYLSVPLADE